MRPAAPMDRKVPGLTAKDQTATMVRKKEVGVHHFERLVRQWNGPAVIPPGGISYSYGARPTGLDLREHDPQIKRIHQGKNRQKSLKVAVPSGEHSTALRHRPCRSKCEIPDTRLPQATGSEPAAHPFSGCSTSVKRLPCAASEPARPPPAPRSTHAAPTARTAPRSGPATYTQ
jgi:hypothetical protein